MTKKIVIGGGIILVLVVLGVILATSQSLQPTGEVSSIQPPQNEAVVSTSSASSAAPAASYTLADVARHATQFDCWMAIEGKVYDVTSYVGKHPGGKAILRGCGKDATVLFNTRPDGPGTPHPPEARQILQQFYVGNLKS